MLGLACRIVYPKISTPGQDTREDGHATADTRHTCIAAATALSSLGISTTAHTHGPYA